MKRFLIFSVSLSLTSPIFFMLFLIFYNNINIPLQFPLSIISSYSTLIFIFFFLIKKFKIRTKVAFISFIVLIILSSIFIIIYLYLPAVLMIFNLGPAKHWPIIFIAQRLNLSGYSICWTEEDKLFKREQDLIRAKWIFKKPTGFKYMYSIKFTKNTIEFASFYYSDKKFAEHAFAKYKDELIKAGFKDTYLNLSLKKVYDELVLYNYATMENGSVIVHCELLVRERSNNAAILVIIADKNETDLLRTLLE